MCLACFGGYYLVTQVIINYYCYKLLHSILQLVKKLILCISLFEKANIKLKKTNLKKRFYSLPIVIKDIKSNIKSYKILNI